MNRRDDQFADFESAELGQAISNLTKLEAPRDAVERLVDHASLRPSPTRANPLRQKANWQRWLGLTAAAAMIVGLYCLAPFFQSKDLFANMQQAIEKQNFRCVTRIVDGEDNTLGTIRSFVDESGSIRQEIQNGPVIVADFREAQMLTLEAANRTATISPIFGVESNENFFFEIVRVLTGDLEGSAEEVGTTQEGDRTLIEFEVAGVNVEANVFINVETNLPEKVVLPQGNVTTAVLTDFEFNLNLERELFSITPPEGYEILEVSFDPDGMTPMVLSPANGLGPVSFGATIDQTIAQFGQPDSQFETEIEVFTAEGPVIKQKTVLIYDSRGFQVQVHPDQGVFLISCFDRKDGQMGTRRFAGNYLEQIEFEMGVAEVESLLGAPYLRDGMTESETEGTLTYYDEDLNTTSHISFHNNRVISFSVFKGD